MNTITLFDQRLFYEEGPTQRWLREGEPEGLDAAPPFEALRLRLRAAPLDIADLWRAPLTHNLRRLDLPHVIDVEALHDLRPAPRLDILNLGADAPLAAIRRALDAEALRGLSWRMLGPYYRATGDDTNLPCDT